MRPRPPVPAGLARPRRPSRSKGTNDPGTAPRRAGGGLRGDPAIDQRKVAIKVLLGGEHASASARKRFDARSSSRPSSAIRTSSRSSTPARRGRACGSRHGRRPRQAAEPLRPRQAPSPGGHAASLRAGLRGGRSRASPRRGPQGSEAVQRARGLRREPQVLDFGLARLLARPEGRPCRSRGGHRNAPVHVARAGPGDTEEIDARSDVYSLGVMLYEVLTGRFPYPVAGQFLEVLRNITETPPAVPSAAWDSTSGVTRRASKAVRPGECPIDRDLQVILLKAIAKERERRYQGCADLQRDLNHLLAGEAIEAKGDSGWYVARKSVARFSRRHQLLIAAGLALGLLAASGVGWVSYKAARDREFLQAERRAKAGLLVREGVAMQRDNNLVSAEQRFEEALSLDPSNYQALGNLAIVKKDAYFANLDTDSPLGTARGVRVTVRSGSRDQTRGIGSLEPEVRCPVHAAEARRSRGGMPLGHPLQDLVLLGSLQPGQGPDAPGTVRGGAAILGSGGAGCEGIGRGPRRLGCGRMENPRHDPDDPRSAGGPILARAGAQVRCGRCLEPSSARAGVAARRRSRGTRHRLPAGPHRERGLQRP